MDDNALAQSHQTSFQSTGSSSGSPRNTSALPQRTPFRYAEIKEADRRDGLLFRAPHTGSGLTNGASGSTTSLSSLAGNYSNSPMRSSYTFGEAVPVRVPNQSKSKGDALSPSTSTATLSPTLSPSLSSTSRSHLSIPSNTSASGSNRTYYASASSHSLFGASPTRLQGSSMRNSSNNSDHSRHSSGAGSTSVFPGYGGGINLYGSVTSHSTGGSASGSLNTDGSIDFTSRKGTGKPNVSIGSLASALARSNLSEQAAFQMVTSGSNGSSGEGSAHSMGNLPLSSSLPRATFTRQSFSDGSPFSTSGSPRMSSTSPVPVSQSTTGPLSAADPRTQLHISNLPFRVRWQDVKDLFRKAGTVLRADVSLTTDNRSRGYGSVLLATEEDAKRACDMFNGFNWQGRTLDVQIDRSGTLLGGGQAVNPAIMLTSMAEPSPTSLPLAITSSGGFDPNGSSTMAAHLSQNGTVLGSLRIGAQQPAQLGTGVSPALYPFLGSTSRNSISGASASSLHQNGYSPNQWSNNGLYNQQRSSSISAAIPPNQHQIPSPFVQQQQQQRSPGLATTPQHHQTIQQHQQQPPSFVSPFLAPAPMQSYQSNPLPGSMAGPSHLSTLNTMPSMSNATSSSPMPPSLPQHPPVHPYYGRVLFVGNLPFHCQWQDLKDLFRAAGHIQRADVALSAEGKSRGFGTVLFATPEDAQNAVRIYHGYEYSGRTLKVHFDRFAQMTVPVSGALPASPSQYTGAFAAANTPSVVNPTSNQQREQVHNVQPQQHFLQSQQGQYVFNDQWSHDASRGAPPYSTYSPFAEEEAREADGRAAERSPQIDSNATTGPPSQPNASSNARITNPHPGRISLPPQAFPSYPNQGMNQFGPVSNRMSVPMTPGMPGFTFHPLSPSSPIHPQILSPGINGPFSPLLGSPLYGGLATPGAGSSAFNPHINHAPGAPIYFANGMTTPISNVMSVPPGYNPMFPPVEANYSMNHQQNYPPAQQAFHLQQVPQTPHWSQPRHQAPTQAQRQSKPVTTAETVGVGKSSDIASDEVSKANKTNGNAEEALEVDDGNSFSTDKNGYFFPLVQPNASALLQRRASTNTPADTPALNGHSSSISTFPPKSPGSELRRGSVASSKTSEDISLASLNGAAPDITQLQATTGAKSTEELARKIAQMSAQKALRQQGIEKVEDANST